MEIKKQEQLKEYYNDLLNRATKPEKKEYYLNMIQKVNNLNTPKPKRKCTKNKKVYVKYLNKTFKSTAAASKALGKNRSYISNMFKMNYKNEFGVKLIY